MPAGHRHWIATVAARIADPLTGLSATTPLATFRFQAPPVYTPDHLHGWTLGKLLRLYGQQLVAQRIWVPSSLATPEVLVGFQPDPKPGRTGASTTSSRSWSTPCLTAQAVIPPSSRSAPMMTNLTKGLMTTLLISACLHPLSSPSLRPTRPALASSGRMLSRTCVRSSHDGVTSRRPTTEPWRWPVY